MKNNLFGRLVDSIMLGLEEKERWEFFQIVWDFMVDEHGENEHGDDFSPDWEEFAVKNNIGFKTMEVVYGKYCFKWGQGGNDSSNEEASIFWKVGENGSIHELPEGATIYIKDATGKIVKVSRS